MSIKATVNPAAETTETTETTKEEQIADARENETALLDGLLAAADFKSCRKKFTKFVKSKVQGGIRVPEEVNAVNYRAELIFRATTPEDQVKVWCNKALWKKLDLVTGYEAVNALLMAGEKEAVLSLIDQISGYELSEEDVAKN